MDGSLSRLTCTLVILGIMYAMPVLAEWEVVDARWRPDANPWAEKQVWDGWIWSEGWSEEEQFWPKHFKPAGSIHVILRNDSAQADTVALTHVDGVPIADLVTSPERAAPVIWYRVERPRLRAPRTGINPDDEQWRDVGTERIEPGDWVECSMRFRSTPAQALRLRFRSGSQGHIEVPVATEPPSVRLEAVCFSARIDRIFIYVRSLDGKRIAKASVRLDGADVNTLCQWTQGPKASGLTLAEVELKPVWEYGSHHLIEVELSSGTRLAQPVRAWDGFFTIGMYGRLEPDRVKDAKAHGINTYFTSGVSALLDDMGLNYVPGHNVGEGRTRTSEQTGTLFYQNRDEPDAHDFSLGRELLVMDRLGIHGQAKVLPLMRYQRARDPRTPNLLLVDNTYKPLHWYVYGQIPDIYCTDPYVPLNGRQVDYVWHALETARDACTPRPLISILWATSLSGEKRRFGKRAPLPGEERMMVFYALGSGVKGYAYFIDLTATTGEGEFVGLSDIPRLWGEVGRINRDVQALAPYLSIGCPVPLRQETEQVWVRTLMCGRDHMILLVVNKNHYIGYNTRTEHAWHTPASDVKLDVSLPGHFRKCRVEEVKDGRLIPAAATIQRAEMCLDVAEVDTARAFLISAEAD